MNKILSYYLQEEKKLKKTKSTSSLRVALITTFTAKGLSSVLRVMCSEQGIDLQIYEVPYKQYNQVLRNKTSELYAFAPHITFFIADPAALIPGYEDVIRTKKDTQFIESSYAEFHHLLDLFQQYSQGLIVVSTLVSSPAHVFGVFARRFPYSAESIVQQFNTMLYENYSETQRIFIHDMEAFIKQHGWRASHNNKLYFLGDYFIAPEVLPDLGYQLIGYIKAFQGKTKKCIVVDLDNTLWGGIIGEDGMQGIKIGPTPPGNAFLHFQKTLLQFYQRGILLAINSNNNPTDALEVLKHHPDMVLRPEHFAALYINWNDKAANMKAIAKELNIGMDSLVFIDDDPKKRLMIQKLLPEVLTIDVPSDPSEYSTALLSLNDFAQMSLTDEDFSRGEKYAAQSQRKVLHAELSSLDEYLQSLEVRVVFRRVDAFTIPRIAQLTQRTNQFNMTTRRYTEENIKQLVADTSYVMYVTEVADRFGSYGIVGVLIAKVDKEKAEIDSFLMSCRVLGMGVEQSILHQVTKELHAQKKKYLTGDFIPTAKNKPASEVYKTHGFIQKTRSDISSGWVFDLTKGFVEKPAHIAMQYEK